MQAKRLLGVFVGVSLLGGALAGCGTSRPAARGPVRLVETGSTLLYPLFNIWVPDYQAGHPDVRITTQGTGSGTGISQAIQGVVQIGASDAYLSPAQLSQNPGLMNIPLAISAQVLAYNLPGLNGVHLKLNGPVLAGIYSGRILYWNDPALKALNPGVNLPHQRIIAVHRTDGSGDSFIFTQYLSKTDSDWASQVGYGTNPSWPAVRNAIGAQGNPGMVQALEANPYAIAYVGISWLDQIRSAKLGTALLENAAGDYPPPTQADIQAAAASLAAKTPADEAISLIDAPGKDSYPIINYEYAIVRAQQPDSRTAKALAAFLDWAVDPSAGDSPRYLDRVHFVPLPAKTVSLSRAQIAKIH